jgi:ankyrin repeat protein
MVRYVIQHEHKDKELIRMTLEGYDETVDSHDDVPYDDYSDNDDDDNDDDDNDDDDNDDDDYYGDEYYTHLEDDRMLKIDYHVYAQESLVHWIAETNDTSEEIVEEILSRVRNINAKTLAGYTALHYAAENDNIIMVIKLLDRKARINENNNESRNTALHISIRKKRSNIVKLLMKRGANIHVQNNNKDTPLHIAVRAMSLELVYALLKHGAEEDLYVSNAKRKTPIQSNHWDMRHIFLIWFMETDPSLAKVERELRRSDQTTKDIVRTGIVSLRLRNIPNELAIRITIQSLGPKDLSIKYLDTIKNERSE